jgi:acyl-CoA synthetase (AMP-forming)/AMP-acid ligase II
MAEQTAQTLGDVAREQARTRGGKVAFSFEGRDTTFGELDANASRVANALTAAGVGRGDRIAYVGKNSADYFELLLGAAKAGAVMAPVNWRLAPPEVAYILADAGAKAAFVGPEFGGLVRGALGEGDAPTLIAMEGGEADWPAYADWRAPRPTLTRGRPSARTTWCCSSTPPAPRAGPRAP